MLDMFLLGTVNMRYF